MRDERPVLLAYDGSMEARSAIFEAALQLGRGRPAVVLTVSQPLAALPFAGSPAAPAPWAEDHGEREARVVAEEGTVLARAAGFDATARAEQGDPIWQRIGEVAEELDAAVIVLGSHGRTGIQLLLMGSVSESTARHTERPVLIAHRAA
jgi:nucleotide-binding universal stress UspA family protein